MQHGRGGGGVGGWLLFGDHCMETTCLYTNVDLHECCPVLNIAIILYY